MSKHNVFSIPYEHEHFIDIAVMDQCAVSRVSGRVKGSIESLNQSAMSSCGARPASFLDSHFAKDVIPGLLRTGTEE